MPWRTSLAAFAFVRLLTMLPIAPGGLGITELGLVAILAASAGHRVTAQVTAAVLLWRAVTYLSPIPLGAAACFVWRHVPALIHTSPGDAGPASLRRVDGTGQPARMPRTDEMHMHCAPCPLDAAGSWCAGALAQLMNSAIAMNWQAAAAQT